jgi:hypothetical protein
MDQLAFQKIKGNSGCRYFWYDLQLFRHRHSWQTATWFWDFPLYFGQ